MLELHWLRLAVQVLHCINTDCRGGVITAAAVTDGGSGYLISISLKQELQSKLDHAFEQLSFTTLLLLPGGTEFVTPLELLLVQL